MIRHIFAAAAMTLGTVSGAAAFDLPPPVDAPEITMMSSSSSGWYIRGDLGYNGAVTGGKPSYRVYDANNDSYSSNSFDLARIGNDYTLNLGGGYQFNEFLRTDLTLDYFKAALTGKSQLGVPCASFEPAATNCGFRHSGEFAALGLLANGYVDLGTYWGVTPYLGAGAGVSNVDWGAITTGAHCRNGGATCTPNINYATVTNEGAESWRFTYALMAGMSYDISAHTKIDFGYRFSRIAGGDMFDFSEAEQNAGATGPKGRDKGFTRHEFRAGLRLTTW